MSTRLNRLLFQFAMFFPKEFRLFTLKRIGVIAPSSKMRYLGKHLYFDFPKKVKIGNYCILDNDIIFRTGGSNAHISIYDNVSIGMNTTFMCISHKVGDYSNRAGNATYSSIIVESGSWIGCNCTILGGVTIGKGCVIGAGSVVIHDCEPNCLYAGNPARKIKSYPEIMD